MILVYNITCSTNRGNDLCRGRYFEQNIMNRYYDTKFLSLYDCDIRFWRKYYENSANFPNHEYILGVSCIYTLYVYTS